MTCPACGVCFINPQYGLETYADFYSRNYFQDLGGKSLNEVISEVRDSYHRAFGPFFKEFLAGLPAQGRYLDVGAGTGIFLDFFFDTVPGKPRDLVAVLEPSLATCERIQSKYPGIVVQREMLETNRFSDGEFNSVLCSALIEHFVDPLLALLHLNRILSEGGRLMLLTPKVDVHSIRKGADAFFKFVHTFYYTPSTIDSLLRKAGFEIERIDEHRDPKPTDTIWYTTLLISAIKTRRRTPDDLVAVRTATSQDAANVAEAEGVFRTLNYQLALRKARRVLGSVLRRPLKLLSRP